MTCGPPGIAPRNTATPVKFAAGLTACTRGAADAKQAHEVTPGRSR